VHERLQTVFGDLEAALEAAEGEVELTEQLTLKWR
jgi:hypothetical protein